MDSQTSPQFSRSVPLLPTYIYGIGLAFSLFFLIRQGWLSHPWLDRYIIGHPISLIETGMFCVGAVALGLKAWQLQRERQQLQGWRPLTADEAEATSAVDVQGPETEGASAGAGTALQATGGSLTGGDSSWQDDSTAMAERFLLALRARSAADRHSSLVSRIAAVLEFVRSRQSVQDVDQQLKHLANQDADAQHESYSLIRLMVWAIPMLGFLGTVLGISEALGGLNLGADADLSALITSLKSSLYVAFDTTALALTFGVALMFAQFGLDRVETENLRQVDALTDSFVHTHFQVAAAQTEQPSRAISRMGQALLKATFSLVEHQHELWNESLVAAQDAWIAATENSAQQSETMLRTAVAEAGEQIATRLTEALGTAEQQLEHRAQQWQVSMSDNTRVLARFQENAATHLQLLEKFFQNASSLSEQQQSSVGQLIGSIQQLVEQTQVTQSTWQEDRAEQREKESQVTAELERLRSAQFAATRDRQREVESRMAAEIAAREAAEQHARAEAEARTAAEGLVSAETIARRLAEQQARAAEEAKQRAEELAKAAVAARKLAERQLTLEAENRRLRLEQQASDEAAAAAETERLAAEQAASAASAAAALEAARETTRTAAALPSLAALEEPECVAEQMTEEMAAEMAELPVELAVDLPAVVPFAVRPDSRMAALGGVGQFARWEDAVAEVVSGGVEARVNEVDSDVVDGGVEELCAAEMSATVASVTVASVPRALVTEALVPVELPPVDWAAVAPVAGGEGAASQVAAESSAAESSAAESSAAESSAAGGTGRKSAEEVKARPVNPHVRSNLLPFPDAKIVRAA